MRRIDLDCDHTEIYLNGLLITTITCDGGGATVKIPGSPFTKTNDQSRLVDHSNDWNFFVGLVPVPNGAKHLTPRGWVWYTNITSHREHDERVVENLIDEYGTDRVKVFTGAYYKDGRFDPNMMSVWVCNEP
jgi:hypothetical protein